MTGHERRHRPDRHAYPDTERGVAGGVRRSPSGPHHGGDPYPDRDGVLLPLAGRPQRRPGEEDEMKESKTMPYERGNPLEQLSLADLRRRTSQKWHAHGSDLLPLWVAEMDVPLAPPVADVLRQAINLGDTGYA